MKTERADARVDRIPSRNVSTVGQRQYHGFVSECLADLSCRFMQVLVSMDPIAMFARQTPRLGVRPSLPKEGGVS